MEVMKLVVEGEEGGEREIFCEHPHSTWDNYFSGDQIMNLIGGDLFGATMTCRRDRLPGYIEGSYLQKKQTLLIIQRWNSSSILFLSLITQRKYRKREQVTMGRTLNMSSARPSNVSI